MISHDEIETVRICIKCGRGFPAPSKATSGATDTLPIWWTQDEQGERCGGRVLDVSKSEQIRKVQHDQTQSDNA